jgi:hypothetical protein
MKTFEKKTKPATSPVRRRRTQVLPFFDPTAQIQCAQIRELLRPLRLQAKLTIGQPGDKYEQEADRVADEVMRMPEPRVQRLPEEEEEEDLIQTKPLADQITPLVQRQVRPEKEEEEEPIHTKLLSAESSTLQRQENEEEEYIQPKAESSHSQEITPDLELRIQCLKGGGQPLPKSERAFFEPRFGYDFSQVQVHRDGPSAGLARSVSARAFTLGKDIIFGGRQYAPETSSGKKLLAHELTHVVQQTGLTYAIKGSHLAQVVKGKQAVSRLTGSFSWSPQLQRVDETRVSTRRFRGPVGRLIDHSLARGLKATSIRHVAIGGAWPEGYPLVPAVYDGFLNFTFIEESYNAVLVEREGQYLEIPLDNIRQYVRFTPAEKGVWSARWIAIAYPGVIKKIGEVLMTGGPVAIIIGMLMFRMGEEGLYEAAEAGIPEARELLEEQEEEELPKIAATTKYYPDFTEVSRPAERSLAQEQFRRLEKRLGIRLPKGILEAPWVGRTPKSTSEGWLRYESSYWKVFGKKFKTDAALLWKDNTITYILREISTIRLKAIRNKDFLKR